MVWIDQPIGTGLSSAAPGAPALIRTEDDVAEDFAGFWKNFIDTFDMQGYKVYLTGESYAGMYIPYIASHFLDQNDTTYYNVKGIQINDPSIGSGSVLEEAPAVQFLNTYSALFNLNETFTTEINERAENCGYNDFLEEALTFPPAGKFPKPTSYKKTGTGIFNCDVWDDIATAALYVNPCFNFYHITVRTYSLQPKPAPIGHPKLLTIDRTIAHSYGMSSGSPRSDGARTTISTAPTSRTPLTPYQMSTTPSAVTTHLALSTRRSPHSQSWGPSSSAPTMLLWVTATWTS